MRLAINIATLTDQAASIELYDAANLSFEKTSAKPIATIDFEKVKGRWTLLCTSFSNGMTAIDKLVMGKLIKASAEAAKEAVSIKQERLTPLLLVRALLARRAVQVALDIEAKRFRCISTMKEGSSTFNLLGLAFGMTVEAEDEETAVKIAKRDVANAMIESPEKAVELSAFFSGGCKVKKLVSGALPDFTKIEALAENPAEKELAKTPVKLFSKVDDE